MMAHVWKYIGLSAPIHVWEFETCGCPDCVARRAARQERNKLEREGIESFEPRRDDEDGVIIRGPQS